MKVSVVVPVYQVSAYIERCIRSVMYQTYKDVECIIVDDATQDDSIEKCQQLIGDYRGRIRFKILHHKVNSGLSFARNTGTDAASGSYIFYLDGDDEISSDCIEKLVKPCLIDNSIEMVMGGTARHHNGKQTYKILLEKDFLTKESVRNYFFSKNGFYVGAWNKLIRKDFIVKNKLYFKEGLLYEDQLWTFGVVKHLSHLYRIPDITYSYYIRPHSITTGTIKETASRHWCLIYDEIAHHFTPRESGREAKFYAKGLCVRYVEYHWCKEKQKFIDYYINALSDSKYVLDKYLLKTTVSLSESKVGWTFLYFLVSIVKSYSNKHQPKVFSVENDEKTTFYRRLRFLGL